MKVGRRFKSRIEGYGQASHYWICPECRKLYTRKTKRCACGEVLWHCNSKVELERIALLLRLQDFGEIYSKSLEHHPRYPLEVTPLKGGEPIQVAVYEADAAYVNSAGERVVEDVKPKAEKAQDPVFRLKRRMFEAQYGQPITIVS